MRDGEVAIEKHLNLKTVQPRRAEFGDVLPRDYDAIGQLLPRDRSAQRRVEVNEQTRDARQVEMRRQTFGDSGATFTNRLGWSSCFSRTPGNPSRMARRSTSPVDNLVALAAATIRFLRTGGSTTELADVVRIPDSCKLSMADEPALATLFQTLFVKSARHGSFSR